MGTTALNAEAYANKIIKEREGAYKLLRRSAGGYSRYRIARLDFEVRPGSGYCEAAVSELVMVLKAEQQVFHLISVRNCPNGIAQYEAPLEKILDSFFLYP